jgi:hypothetical protein
MLNISKLNEYDKCFAYIIIKKAHGHGKIIYVSMLSICKILV